MNLDFDRLRKHHDIFRAKLEEQQEWLQQSPDALIGDSVIDVANRLKAERDELKSRLGVE